MSDDDGHFTVNFPGQIIDLEEVRRRSSPFMPDGGHAWVINTVFALDDPDQAMDTMELTEKNFVGVTSIYCLLCNTRYDRKIRYYKCSQKKQSQ